MTTIVASPTGVAAFPDGGGHAWVYLQYVHGLRAVGCDVYWLERFQPTDDQRRDAHRIDRFLRMLRRHGLEGKGALYISSPRGHVERYIGCETATAERVFGHADLLLNFDYTASPALLSRFRRTALVDIDPGLLQFWMANGQLEVSAHDLYFTTGETVGTSAALFPDCGVAWIHIRPPVHLALWPYVYDPACEAYTTVSSWWGDEWITDGHRIYENNKRVSFLEFASVPTRAMQTLELALCLGDGDAEDRRLLERNGWRIRHAQEVAATADRYRSYIQRSRGEFSCAKPSCIEFQNAWVSDRTITYLASGKPVVVQHTGPSSFLPEEHGLFRFRVVDEAVDALKSIESAYESHCRAAREIAETYFDARTIMTRVLDAARL